MKNPPSIPSPSSSSKRLTAILLLVLTSSSLGFTPLTRITAKRNTHQISRNTFLAAPLRSSTSEETTVESPEEEWHPRDPAQSTPQLLSSIWHMISTGCNTLTRGQELTIIFPLMVEQINTPSYQQRLFGHLDICKDVCADYGIETLLVPYKNRSGKVEGFTVKSYKNPDSKKADPNDETGGYKFNEYDPFWDDDFEIDMSMLPDEEEDEDSDEWDAGMEEAALPPLDDSVPEEDEEIIDVTRTWVNTMMSNMGICPFTSGADMAGLPLGKVFYTVSRLSNIEDVYAAYWKEVVRVEQNPEKELSTTLMITPEFSMQNGELFENFSSTLTSALEPLQVEDLLQLVFFHPRWTFRDGAARAGDGNAANYARRSPWPMINILRTKQVRAAQRGIPTGLVYQQNERTLNDIGARDLESYLRTRDWEGLADYKVDRRQMEALRVAQDLQQGLEVVEDTRIEFDPTPAVNKVDKRQVEGGDVVNVLAQALEKRLVKNEMLTGPEISATLMAIDFLLDELKTVAEGGMRMEEAMEDDEMDALWGRSGVGMQDEGYGETGSFGQSFSEGNNPANFY